MEKRKVSKRRQTGTTAKDDIELFQSPPNSPLLTPKSSHLATSLEAPSQLQTPLSSPPTSRPPSPNPTDIPCLIPLPNSLDHQWNAIGTNVLWNSPRFTHMPSPTSPISQSTSSSSPISTKIYHPYASYIRTLDLTYLTEHDRNNSALSSHLLRLLPLIHMENLHTLNLSFVKGITNNYLTKLLAPFFNCVKTLNLAGGSRSDKCLSSIIPYCHQVQNLSLAWNTSLSDTSINKIATICGGSLRKLDLTNCEKVSDISLIYISQYCTKLRELKVSYCRGVSEEGIRAVIERCETLRVLDLLFAAKGEN
nr:9793_t:CDS:2 [Entrophospora candida]